MVEDLGIEACCFSPFLSSILQLPGDDVGGGGGSQSFLWAPFLHGSVPRFPVVTSCLFMERLRIIDVQMESPYNEIRYFGWGG